MFIKPHLTKLIGNQFVGRKVENIRTENCIGLPYLTGDTIKRVEFGPVSCLSGRSEIFVFDHTFGDGKTREIDIHSINFRVEVSEDEILFGDIPEDKFRIDLEKSLLKEIWVIRFNQLYDAVQNLCCQKNVITSALLEKNLTGCIKRLNELAEFVKM